ncbi:hypothetical protein JXB11_00495 [Candidatus Woesearchaeota archaeon]|nr:hypothetical protein [Candidatus Woesearchaeota archaeon]
MQASEVPAWVRESGISVESFAEVMSGIEANREKILGTPVSSINERRFDGKKFAVAYAPDFSKISNQHFYEGKIRCLDTLELEGDCTMGEPYEGVFVLKFPFGIYKFVEKLYEDPLYADRVAEIKQTLEERCESELDTVESMIEQGKFADIDVLALYEATNKYGSMNLDGTVAYEDIEEVLEKVYPEESKSTLTDILKALTTSPIDKNTHITIYFAKLGLLEQKLKGKEPDIDAFIKNYGYWECYDLKPGRLEARQNVEQDLEILERFYPTIEEVRKARIETISEREAKKAEHEAAVRMVLRDTRMRRPDQLRIMNDLLRVVDMQQDYDENFRVDRCRFYRCMRDIALHYFGDFDKPLVEDLARAIQMDRNGAYSCPKTVEVPVK